MLLKKDSPLNNCDLKFDDADEGVFSGYASRFNGNDSDNDTILPGAFKKSLKSGKVIKGFFNHDQRDVPVVDYIKLREDDEGLLVEEGRIDFNHHLGKSLHSALVRKALDAFSIGFRLDKKDFDMKEGHEDEWFGYRNIKNMDLMEISIVSFPADTGAVIDAVKTDIDGFVTLRDFEDYLREAGGFSKSMATALVSQLGKVYRGEHDTKEEQTTKAASVIACDLLTNLRKTI